MFMHFHLYPFMFHYFDNYDSDSLANYVLFYILGTGKLHLNFSSIPKDAHDIHRFSNMKWVLTMCTTGNQ